MFNFFKKREKKPTPPWVIWMMLGVLAYALLSSQQKGSEVNRAVENTGKNLSNHFSGFEKVKKRILPTMISTIRPSDIKLGKGQPAVCGQTATITYNSWLTADKPVGDKATKDNPLTFTIGANKVLPAFERGIIGMQVDGRRSIIASSEFAYGAAGFSRDDVEKNATIKFELELLKLEPKLPDMASSAYRIVDTVVNVGDPIYCGRTIRAHVVIWNVEGKEIYSTRSKKSPIEFTPGQSDVFLGLEQGVIGMSTRGQRMLIVPADFQKTMNSKKSIFDFNLPKKETVLVEVEVLP